MRRQQAGRATASMAVVMRLKGGALRGRPEEVVVELGKGGVRVDKDGGEGGCSLGEGGARGRGGGAGSSTQRRWMLHLRKGACLQPAARAESWALRRPSARLAGPSLSCSGAQAGFCRQEGSSRHFFGSYFLVS